MLSQNNSNYLLVGARQLGKTAILQALERRYANDEKAECFYVTFQAQSNLVKALARVLKMTNPENISLDELVEHISHREKKAIFLLDEMDKIVEEDTKNDHLFTSTFRKLSQEGKASFVLTGFSTLYFAVTLEQNSPLLNFGKIIVLEGLEQEACRELMVEPMKSLGITYESDEVVERLIERCGRRANLLAITCSEIIQSLDENERVITQNIVDSVVQKIDLDRYKLSTWGRISSNVDLNVLDRLIVYLMIKKESFSLEKIVNELEAIKPTIKIENINQSLKRLVIGYVLVKQEERYQQRIPLLKEKLMSGLEVQKKGAIKELLRSEV
ncbi:hypothetical protein MNB_SV-12-292 [hydrothermal vent metagenome]|uniref:ORC1/DEAH AAA+ ATPase domain-containing protein n=1 Tax=hydrothermal vent metagenome TaxID=652676 RepID=A0A1W1C4S4_9ZZZZ